MQRVLGKMNHGVNWWILGQDEVMEKGNQCLCIVLGHLVSLWREEKSNMYFRGASLMSFGSNMDFTKEIPSLLSLIASFVFKDSIGMENYIHWTF